MKAILISVGDELITGATVNTNSAYLAAQLARRGIFTEAHWTVGDDEAPIAEAITRACSSVEIVIVSGGLGPTADDLTRQGLARAMGVELEMNDACQARIEEFFRLRNRRMQPINRIQAMVPRGAEPLDNSVGTAPGLYATIARAKVFVVPGVPSEMKTMFAEQVAPRLPRLDRVILTRTVHTFGVGESDVGAKIADLMRRGADPAVGTTVAAGMVSVRIIAPGGSLADARAKADAAAAAVKARLGRIVIGEDDQTLPFVVGELLRARRQTLATAESCTGGLIGELLTSVAGSSDYYLGGVVAYSDSLKRDLLGVAADVLAAHGAVSEPVAAAMAEGCRARLGADWAISVTGIAGPGGGTEEKPVGLVFTALAGPVGTEVRKHLFPGTREIIRLRSALAALNELRLSL